MVSGGTLSANREDMTYAWNCAVPNLARSRFPTSSAGRVKLANLKIMSCALGSPLPILRIAGLNQSRGLLRRRVAFCIWAMYLLDVFPGLNVALRNWTVSPVGGSAGLIITAGNFTYLFTPGLAEGGGIFSRPGKY